MGYLHIDNLYKNQTVLLFREVYSLEKIHGTSAHLLWKENQVLFFSGGEKRERFLTLFDKDALASGFSSLGYEKMVIYGEAYGGSQQGQSWRYGKNLKFIAFDVKIGDLWLAVPSAIEITEKLGIEFVHYAKVSTDLEALDAERDAPSEQAQRNGVNGIYPREGVVLRPLIELTDNSGSRIIAKHKRDEERETSSPRKVVDPAQMEMLTKASAIAEEWVTPARLEHVLDKMPGVGIEKTGDVIRAMVEDVLREGANEIVDSKEARQAIGKRTATLFKSKIRTIK